MCAKCLEQTDHHSEKIFLIPVKCYSKNINTTLKTCGQAQEPESPGWTEEPGAHLAVDEFTSLRTLCKLAKTLSGWRLRISRGRSYCSKSTSSKKSTAMNVIITWVIYSLAQKCVWPWGQWVWGSQWSQLPPSSRQVGWCRCWGQMPGWCRFLEELTQPITCMTVTLGIWPPAGRFSVRLIPWGAAGAAWAGGGAADGTEEDPRTWGADFKQEMES